MAKLTFVDSGVYHMLLTFEKVRHLSRSELCSTTGIFHKPYLFRFVEAYRNPEGLVSNGTSRIGCLRFLSPPNNLKAIYQRILRKSLSHDRLSLSFSQYLARLPVRSAGFLVESFKLQPPRLCPDGHVNVNVLAAIRAVITVGYRGWGRYNTVSLVERLDRQKKAVQMKITQVRDLISSEWPSLFEPAAEVPKRRDQVQVALGTGRVVSEDV